MRFRRGQTPIPMPLPGLDPDQTAAPPPDTPTGRDEPEEHDAVGADDGEPHPQSPNRPRQGQTETPIGDGVPADDRPSPLSITTAEDERQGHGEPDLGPSPVRPLPFTAAQCQALPVHAICQVLEAGSAGKAGALLDSVERACHAGEVTIYEEQVLYGRLRIQIAIETGKPVRVVEYLGPDPLAYALSHWQDKWDRTKSQRAVAIARVYEWQGTGRPKKPAVNAGFSPDDIPRVTTEVMANEAGVSRKLMQGAKRIVEEDPYLADEVASGHMAVTKAVDVLDRRSDISNGFVKKAQKSVPRRSRGAFREDADVWAHPKDTSGRHDRRVLLEDLEKDDLVEIVLALQDENALLKSERDRMREEISRLRNRPAGVGGVDGAN